MKMKLVSVLFVFFFASFQAFGQDEPLGIFLTWTEDPTTTISIDWHNNNAEPELLSYRKKGDRRWKTAKSSVLLYPFSERNVHRVALNKLSQATTYEIKFGNFDKVYNFRTMPASLASEPVRIAIGGDTMHEKEMLEKTNRQVADQNPHFIVIGGDMAYENGSARAVGRMYDWFDACMNTLITRDNRIIPIVVGIGNHEVSGGYYSPRRFSGSDADREKFAPYFFNLFAFPGHPGYNVLDFGNYLSLFILDTDHANPIEGKQTDWLAAELAKRKDFLHIIPVYHIPAYPSVREFNGSRSAAVRKNWLPLFEQHQVKLAFENHDHAYKRTFPLRNNRIDESGIVFVGDGAWGVKVREVQPVAGTWYLRQALEERHFILLTLQGKHQKLTVISENGKIIDSYPEQKDHSR
jgi:acid phosphatase type 7